MSLAALVIPLGAAQVRTAGQGAGANPTGGAAQPAKGSAQAGQGAIRNDDDPRVKAMVVNAVAYLRTKAPETKNLGEVSLMAHALCKVREKYPDVVGPNDPMVQGMINGIRSHCGNPVTPEISGGHDNYVVPCAAMALAAAGGEAYKAELQNLAQYMIAKQMTHGAWSYQTEGPGGDTSQTQYAILGLWEAAASAGVPIPMEVWDKAAQWLITNQHSSGGFGYHPKDPGSTGTRTTPTHTMAMASLGSLYILLDNLGGIRRNNRGILIPVQEKVEGQSDFKAQTTSAQMNAAIDKAAKWMAQNFVMEKPRGETDDGGTRWVYYYLYALERYATLANITEIAGNDWYAKGADLLLSKQEKNGSWQIPGGGESQGPHVQTAFAILFLVRSTKRSIIIHERRLGRGTLVSSRGLPNNLAELEQQGNKLKAKEIRGRAGDLLGIIESGNAGQAEGAAIGLAKSMYEKKWTAGGEEGDKLRKLLQKGFQTKNPEVIKTTLRLLALTGDYRVVPLLIDGMYYEDDAEVQLSAREALCLISRKFHGFGYSDEPTLEEWKEEIEKWQAWYRSVRPQAAIEDDVLEIK